MNTHLSIFLASLAILTIPLLIWLERSERQLWNSRLFTPDFLTEGSLHEPIVTEGIFLPPVIQSNTNLSSDTPIIISGTVTIPAAVTLTIEPGSTVFVHEYGKLVVEGTLAAEGTNEEPITITTNENHPTNRVWSGIVFTPTAQGRISHTSIRYGHPGITCEQNTRVTVNTTTIELGNLGVYTESESCQVMNSMIRHVDTGVIEKGITAQLTQTDISATKNSVLSFENE